MNNNYEKIILAYDKKKRIQFHILNTIVIRIYEDDVKKIINNTTGHHKYRYLYYNLLDSRLFRELSICILLFTM